MPEPVKDRLLVEAYQPGIEMRAWGGGNVAVSPDVSIRVEFDRRHPRAAFAALDRLVVLVRERLHEIDEEQERAARAALVAEVDE